MGRSRRQVALGLSTAVWPGAGQVYLKRRALGLFLAIGNLAVLGALIATVLLGAARVMAVSPEVSVIAALGRGFAQRAVAVLVLLLAATWAWGVLDVVLRPPQEGRRDSSQDSSAA